ncbi:carbohydrate binding protein [Mucilaginibacter yixingensis]|uniref:Carbohydrate binding protein n=1 Tax=Mucilaginibacter yixingensis TaxID=1295612 RepID=A0A2T5J6T8_9SPHI|nr:carbohydrate binding domain-containing protein [Mucilaginibacter yixingensis]PTQ94171.1 carbohydrate binding protein [Mucilaginibacter yixingensis]
MRKLSQLSLLIVLCFITSKAVAQRGAAGGSKQISPDLFGIFFEDLSYAADGGLYAELVQNRSFEYTPADKKGWNPLTAWDYTTEGFGYGELSVESSSPINVNNPHYIKLTISDPGQKGIGVTNEGYDGIPVKAGEQYNFSLYARLMSADQIPLTVSLRGKKGEVYGEASIVAGAKDWKKYSAVITANTTDADARLVVLAKRYPGIGHDIAVSTKNF